MSIFMDAAETGADCDADLQPGESIYLYLFYVRGDGPETGACCAMRLQASSGDIVMHSFDQAPPPGERLSIGNINDGISFCNHAGEVNWCETGEDVVLFGRITVSNISEVGPFTIKVVGNPNEPGMQLAIVMCDPGCTKYGVIGGTFVFNAVCEDPEFGRAPQATDNSSWGAIKSIYRD